MQPTPRSGVGACGVHPGDECDLVGRHCEGGVASEGDWRTVVRRDTWDDLLARDV